MFDAMKIMYYANHVQKILKHELNYNMPDVLAEDVAEDMAGIDLQDAFQDYMLHCMSKHPTVKG